jgi:site-specific recombinase XerD
MFEDLFVYPKVLARHRAGPSADARDRFLAHCAGYGAARGTLLRLANELLVVAERIDVNSGKSFSLADVEAAAESWTRYQLKRARAHGQRWPRVRFIQVATTWLRFLGCLEERSVEPKAFADQVNEFIAYLRDERGLSANSLRARRWHIECFLRTSVKDKNSITHITAEDIDGFLSLKGKQGWCRVSVATSATALRSFFRYTEMRRWCSAGIASTIDGPRLFKEEGLPAGPIWDDVQRLITSTSGTDARDVRDRAVLMLLAIYGLRSGEVRQLRLEDLDWTREFVRIERSKQRRTQDYPLLSSVGDAILQYLQHARPRCSHRELFVTLKAPFRPLSSGAMYNIVSSRIEALEIRVPRRGPHCLRHGCAGHLVAAGLSLKEIGDHLGHRSAYATRIYAKVDLAGLREVADFDLRGLA